MELPVLSNEQRERSDPWYAQGLRFTCTQCGNCCTGGPGFVWVSEVEIVRLAEFLKMTPEQTVERYCRKIAGRFSLKEKRGPGGYDCVFLVEQEAGGAEGGVPLKRRGCSIYPVRPLQCRTWPFWPENLQEQSKWDHAARRCHGMNHGPRTFTRQQMEALRDAEDWPDNPPTSGPRRGKH